jgi:hypothetical protein
MSLTPENSSVRWPSFGEHFKWNIRANVRTAVAVSTQRWLAFYFNPAGAQQFPNSELPQ